MLFHLSAQIFFLAPISVMWWTFNIRTLSELTPFSNVLIPQTSILYVHGGVLPANVTYLLSTCFTFQLNQTFLEIWRGYIACGVTIVAREIIINQTVMKFLVSWR
jgi:hypothetical protein